MTHDSLTGIEKLSIDSIRLCATKCYDNATSN